MKFKLVITPSIHPELRHKIEDVIESDGFTVIGGGQMTNETFSDISFERDDSK